MPRIVCVTGGGGFLGAHVIMQLLEKGYTVRGTVRSLADKAKISHLNKLGAALPGRLELMEADLMVPNSFDKAVEGCCCIIHTASPFQIDVKNPQQDLLDPAILGTETVLRSARKHKQSVQRIILTSSVAAVHGEYAAPPVSGQLYNEQDWNETSSIENGQAYHLSKVSAEKRAVQLAAEAGMKLVAICPNFILGPPLSARVDGLSVQFMKDIMEGKSEPAGTPIICDVRDVARAHVAAVEQPLDRLQNRYIVSHASGMSSSFVSQVLGSNFPQAKILPGTDDATPDKIDACRLQELGFHLIPARETLVDMASALIALGIVQL